jgi:hypothetical protein
MSLSRALPASLVALLCSAAPALATHPAPAFPLEAPVIAPTLEGTGENVKLVANLDMGSAKEIELAGDYAYVTGLEGLHIVDIANPLAPKQVSSICTGSFGDVGLNPEATIAIIAADGGGNECQVGPKGDQTGKTGGVAVVDITNKRAPKLLSYIDAPTGAHTATLHRDLVVINNYDQNYRKAEIYSIAVPTAPKKIGEWNVNGTAFHDSWFDRRPDGKVLLYGASISASDVVDLTDPTKPTSLQRIYDPEVGIQHELQINHKRDVLMLTDEYGGGAAGPACGKSPSADPTYLVPVVGAPQDLGAIHFYKATADGTFSNAGVDKLSTWNVPIQENNAPDNGCTAHVFWQAPDENRMTIAWYGRGLRILDYTDPSKPTEIGHFIAENANMWSGKPHRGYIFSSDLNRGMDVYQFTGKGWPATAGPAEAQRARAMGVAPTPIGSAPTGGSPSSNAGAPASQGGRRAAGTFSKTFKFRKALPGKKGKRVKLRIEVRNPFNALVGRATVSKKARTRPVLRLTGSGEVGGYRLTVLVGKKKVGTGGFQIRPKAGRTVAAGAKLKLRAR